MSENGKPPFRRPAARWIFPSTTGTHAEEFAQALGLPRAVAQILANRGFTSIDAVREFLSPRLDRLHDPFLLTGMDAAVDRLQKAIARREHILIYGDYDVDGTTSVVVLKKTLDLLGAVTSFHIPHRLREGYGMRSEAIAEAAAAGVKVIVSVDTGIRAIDAVKGANELGIDVLITDHHLPDSALPAALAVINPNQPCCAYPCKHLCGAGVTFKLVHALISRSGLSAQRQAALLDSFLKPVAIATVADIVPLTGENRVIVRRGLTGMRDVKNAGLRALLAVAGLDEGEAPSAHQVAFQLAPRINAAGRMATAQDVIELFLTSDPARAANIAGQLDALNRQRQQAEREIVESILASCEKDASCLDAAALVFWAPDWHLGVLGIVASRLVERFCRPTFVLGTGLPTPAGQTCLTGSGRSVPGFHLLEALESMPELFVRFGGHRGAAGLTLSDDHAESFRQRFASYAAERLTDEDRRPQFIVDASLSLTELNDRLVDHLFNLGPFGFSNAAPVLHCAAAEVAAGPQPLGGSDKHLRVALRHGTRTVIAKAWNFGDRADLFTRGNRLDVLFQVEDDPHSRKRGYPGWTVSIKDVRPS